MLDEVVVKIGVTLSIEPQEQSSSQLFKGFLCHVKHMANSTAYKTLKKLQCAIMHPVTDTPGLDVTIYVDPATPYHGFLKKDASLIPIRISY